MDICNKCYSRIPLQEDDDISLDKPTIEIIEDKNLDEKRPFANYTLVILTILNLLNYCDRYIPAVTKEVMKHEWNLTDAETGLPMLVFLLSYMVSCPVFGTFADCGISRKILLGSGIVFWSAAASSGFWAHNLVTFLISRGCVGIGEASFTTIAPSFLSDFFPPKSRNTILAIFYLSMPIGSAVGFGLGGLISSHFGWRYAYLLTGIPGMLIAISIFPIKDPGLGYFDEKIDINISWLKSISIFLKKRLYVILVISGTLNTFGIGGVADWLPAFFERKFPSYEPSTLALIIGGTTFFGGIFGTILGGVLGEFFMDKIRHPYLVVCILSCYVSVFFNCIVIFIEHDLYVTAAGLFLAEVCIFSYGGPVMAQITILMPGKIRTRAIGLHNLIIHTCGDAISPVLLGLISDTYHNISLALSIVPLSIILSGMTLLTGWFILEEKEGKSGGEFDDMIVSEKLEDCT